MLWGGSLNWKHGSWVELRRRPGFVLLMARPWASSCQCRFGSEYGVCRIQSRSAPEVPAFVIVGSPIRISGSRYRTACFAEGYPGRASQLHRHDTQ